MSWNSISTGHTGPSDSRHTFASPIPNSPGAHIYLQQTSPGATLWVRSPPAHGRTPHTVAHKGGNWPLTSIAASGSVVPWRLRTAGTAPILRVSRLLSPLTFSPSARRHRSLVSERRADRLKLSFSVSSPQSSALSAHAAPVTSRETMRYTRAPSHRACWPLCAGMMRSARMADYVKFINNSWLFISESKR